MSTEQLGSVTVETAGLLAVVQGWASDHASDRDGAAAPIENIDPGED